MIAETRADEDEIFVYMGGDQHVPVWVRRARIHKSVKIVPRGAFRDRRQLISVEFHDGVEIIEENAFNSCHSLRGPIKLLGVKIIKHGAFLGCESMAAVECGDKLETIEQCAFQRCRSLKNIRMPSVRTIGRVAFGSCSGLTDVEFGEALRALHEAAFTKCRNLKRIALPLKDNLIGNHVFNQCNKLSKVDLVGGIHQTVASLHMDESWRNEMTGGINRINQTLPTVDKRGKTEAIKQWMRPTFRRLHPILLKEATTLLELALWKANLDDYNGSEGEREGVRTTRGRRKRARKEICVTSGANIVIKNVLPFLSLES